MKQNVFHTDSVFSTKKSRYSHKDRGMINNDQCSICFCKDSACLWPATEARVLHSDCLGHSFNFHRTAVILATLGCSLFIQQDGFGTVSKTCGNNVEQSVTCFVVNLHNHANSMLYINKLKTSLIFKEPIKMIWLRMTILTIVGL